MQEGIKAKEQLRSYCPNLHTVPSPVTPKLPLCTPPHWANGEIPVKIVVQSVLTKQKMCKMCIERERKKVHI